jgi:hypothetical protein
LIVVCSGTAEGNFGGYEREDIAGVGTLLNIIQNNSIALNKEELRFVLDQRVKYTGVFTF